ncbi:glycosyltransferase [Adhaeribacter terreus]|uniref:Glycosyltransferase n=1 Tax=Adhaeribacter terreus TaxID=529703 RepID=A0ABW0E9D7_9BACT
MTTHLPYQISHVYLHESAKMPALNLQQGNYLVFWWKTIPLGDLYLEPGVTLSEADYFKKMGQAILPTLQQYAKSTSERNQNLQATQMLEKLKNPESWLPEALKRKPTEKIPKEVPVSVIICTRNRPGSLKQCLEAFQKMLCRPQEIIIIENARENDESEAVTRLYPNVKYYQEPIPGLSYARNTGIKKATCPIIAFTDDDVRIAENWVHQVWQTFQDPKTMAMTGLVIASELQSEAQLIFEKHWSFNRGYTDKIFDIEYFRKTIAKGPPVWNIGAGANMAFRKSIFEETGLFDERLGAGASGCNEDSEMWYRILKNGHTIHYNPRAIVFHEHRRELTALKKQIFSYMRGHAAAALIQQEQFRKAGYARHLSHTLLVAYSKAILKGFPQYQAQYCTLWVQIKGLIAGIVYYYQNRKKTELR